MLTRSLTILALYLACTPRPASAQTSAVPDSDLDQFVGRWVAAGVSFQSATNTHTFAVEVKRLGDQIQVTLPSELKLAGGSVYELARAGQRIFRHVDDVGRIVEFSVSSARRATLLVTGSGGDGRITWQLQR